ncbi:MAG: glucose-6-phosphate isomerase [Bacilli bacterium]|nr:glucose-6-phosphate isomerase [Bacilli bacterium]
MAIIKTDLTHLVNEIDLASYQEKVNVIDKMIREGTGEGADFLGWVDWPANYDKAELESIKENAKYVRENYECLVVCGIGGSYLGARAAIEAVNGEFNKNDLEIIWLGMTLDSHYLSQVMDYLATKKFAVNVISKSGTTTETAVAFRLLKDLLEKRDGKEAARKAIFATTDANKGALLELSKKEGYVRFVLPGNIGGRFSVQTAVGLFPIACAGIDPQAVLEGSAEARKDAMEKDLLKNEAYKYAVARHHMYASEKKAVEFFISYGPNIRNLAEWWKQLYGESEGKDQKSLVPASATFTTDLHSLGQFIQDGSPVFFETVFHIVNHRHDVYIGHDEENLDGLNYLEGKSVTWVQEKAYEGTLKAHYEDGNRSNIVLDIESMNAHNLGYIFYFFEIACAMSAYLNGVNPFNQPGVEVYKRNMFHLLGKPGF